MSRSDTRQANYVDKTHSLLQVLQPGLAPDVSTYGWTMDQAIARVSEPAWAKTDWREVAVYLALQYLGAQTHDGARERLTLRRIRSALDDLAEAEERDSRRAGQAAAARIAGGPAT